MRRRTRVKNGQFCVKSNPNDTSLKVDVNQDIISLGISSWQLADRPSTIKLFYNKKIF